MTPEIGKKSPDFSLPREDGTTVSLADFAGKALVVFFYPRANTSGCTTEALGFSAALPEFEAANTAVIGVSKDSIAQQLKFRDKHGLTVPLLSDENGTMCEDFGVWQEKQMYGKTHMGIVRSTFLIGPDGTIRHIWPKVRVPGHVEEVLDAVKAL